MKRLTIVIIICCGHSTMAQTTDSLDNIVYQIPVAWQSNKQSTYTELKFIDNSKKTFCQLVIYAAQPASPDKKADFQNEWKELVEKNFSVVTLAEPKNFKTESGNSFLRLGANAIDKSGNKYYVQLNVFDCGKSIQSVIAVSNNQKQLQQYDSLWQSVILKVKANSSGYVKNDNDKIPSGVGSILIGRWGKTYNPMLPYTSDQFVNLAFSGYKRTEYVFNADGTYTFQGENWGGKENGYRFRLKNEKEYGLIDENGTYELKGNQIIINPLKNQYRIVEKNGKLLRTESFGLQKRSYTCTTYYNPGMQETILVLTTTKTNEIDGEFSSFEPAVSYPNSYGYARDKNMFFTFSPMETKVTTTVNSPVIGHWHKSSSSPSAYVNGKISNLAYSGYTKGEYNFRQDGSYSFQGESWSGYYNSEEYRLIDEKGLFTVNGNKLIITPTASLYRIVDRNGNIKKSEKLSLVNRNYSWQTHYYEGLQETALILTGAKENPVDGGFSSVTGFPDSFIYSPGKKLEFRFQPFKQ